MKRGKGSVFGFEGTGFPCEFARRISYANLFALSSIAQSVEHAAVNRSVVGSSPTGGGKIYVKMKPVN